MWQNFTQALGKTAIKVRCSHKDIKIIKIRLNYGNVYYCLK